MLIHSLIHSISPIELDSDKTRFRIHSFYFFTTNISIYCIITTITLWYLKIENRSRKKEREGEGKSMYLELNFLLNIYSIFVWERYIDSNLGLRMLKKYNRIVLWWRSSAVRETVSKEGGEKKKNIDNINSGIIQWTCGRTNLNIHRYIHRSIGWSTRE